MPKLQFVSLGSDDTALILDIVEAPSVLAALGLIDAQLCLLCGESATLGEDSAFDTNACLAVLKRPGDRFERRSELDSEDDFELILC